MSWWENDPIAVAEPPKGKAWWEADAVADAVAESPVPTDPQIPALGDIPFALNETYGGRYISSAPPASYTAPSAPGLSPEVDPLAMGMIPPSEMAQPRIDTRSFDQLTLEEQEAREREGIEKHFAADPLSLNQALSNLYGKYRDLQTTRDLRLLAEASPSERDKRRHDSIADINAKLEAGIVSPEQHAALMEAFNARGENLADERVRARDQRQQPQQGFSPEYFAEWKQRIDAMPPSPEKAQSLDVYSQARLRQAGIEGSEQERKQLGLSPEDYALYDAQRTTDDSLLTSAPMPVRRILMGALGLGKTGYNIFARATGIGDADESNREFAQQGRIQSALDRTSGTAGVVGPETAELAGGAIESAAQMGMGGATSGASRVSGFQRILGLSFAGTTDQLYTQGKDSGLSEPSAAVYATIGGAAETALTMLFGKAAEKLGFETAEEALSNIGVQRAAKQTIKKRLLGLLGAGIAEYDEEAAISALQSVNDYIAGVDPDGLKNLFTNAHRSGKQGAIGAGLAKGTQALAESWGRLEKDSQRIVKGAYDLQKKVESNQPVTRGDLERVGLSSSGTNPQSRKDIARDFISPTADTAPTPAEAQPQTGLRTSSPWATPQEFKESQRRIREQPAQLGKTLHAAQTPSRQGDSTQVDDATQVFERPDVTQEFVPQPDTNPVIASESQGSAPDLHSRAQAIVDRNNTAMAQLQEADRVLAELKSQNADPDTIYEAEKAAQEAADEFDASGGGPRAGTLRAALQDGTNIRPDLVDDLESNIRGYDKYSNPRTRKPNVPKERQAPLPETQGESTGQPAQGQTAAEGRSEEQVARSPESSDALRSEQPRPEVAQPTKWKRVKIETQTLGGKKSLNGHEYLLPVYAGPPIVVVEKSARKGMPQNRQYEIYLKDTGEFVESSNGVVSLDIALKNAVQRIRSRQSRQATLRESDKASKSTTTTRPTLPADTFIEQVRRTARTPEETLDGEAILTFTELLAEYRGESLDEFVAKGVAGVELTSQKQSRYLKQKASGKPDTLAQKSRHPIRGEAQFLQDGRAIIRLFRETRDLSSFAHEFAHLMRRWLLPEDLAVAEKSLGVKNGKWSRQNEERFARMFERYLREGRAPNRKLREIFANYKKWLAAIYRKLSSSPLAEQIPAELRAVFDTMLGATPARSSENVRQELDALDRRGNVDKDVLDELESLPPEEVVQILDGAKQRAADENQWIDAVRDDYTSLFDTPTDNVISYVTKGGKRVTRKASAAGDASANARLVERRGGDAASIPGFDQKLQALRDGEFPNLAAEASSRGRGDIESGLFDILQGGESQFESKSVDDHIEDVLGEYRDYQTAGQSTGIEDSSFDVAGFESEASTQAGPRGTESSEEVGDSSFNFGASADSFSLSREGSTDTSPVVEPYSVPESQRVAPKKRGDRQPQLGGMPEDMDDKVLPGQQGLFAQEVDDQPTSTKNAVTDSERENYGIPPRMAVVPESIKQWDEEAKKTLQRNPNAGREIVESIIESPRTLSDRDNAIVLNYKVRLQNEIDETGSGLIDANDNGDTDAARDFSARSDQLNDELFNLFEAVELAGTSWGRAGIARQMMLHNDFSLAALVRRKRQAAGGRELTAEENAEIIDLNKKVADLERKLKEADRTRPEREKKEAKQQFDTEYEKLKKKARGERKRKALTPAEMKEKLGAQPKPKKPKQPATLDSIRAKLLNAANSQAKKFATLFNRKRADSGNTLAQEVGDFDGDPDLMAAAAEMAASYREAGVKDWPEFQRAVSDAIGSDTAQAAEDYLRAAWEQAPKPTNGKPTPQPTKPQTEEPSGTLDGDALSEARLSGVARELAKYFIQQGVRGRDNVADSVWGELQKVLPDITRRQTMDAISLYGQYKLLNNDPVAVELRKYVGEMQQVAKLYDMLSGKAPAKTGQERRAPSDEERQLIALVNEYKKNYKIETTDPAKQLKSALDAVKTRLKNQIKDLDQQIRTGQQIVKQRSGLQYDAEAKALQLERDSLREQYDSIFGKRQMTDQQRLEAATKAMHKQWLEYDRRIKEQDFADPARREPPDSPLLLGTKLMRDAARRQFRALKALDPASKAKADAIANERLRAAIAEKMAELGRKLAKKDFSTKKREPKQRNLDAETQRMQAELDVLKTQFHEGLLNDRQKRRLEDEMSRLDAELESGQFTEPTKRPRRETPKELAALEARVKLRRRKKLIQTRKLTPKSVLSWTAEPFRIGRSLILGVDFGQVLNQAKLTFGHPVLNMRALKPMFKAWAKDGAEQALMQEIENHPDFAMAYKAGLELTVPDGDLNKQEEIFQGHLVDKIPGLNNFARAYRVFLNKLRFDLFSQLVKSHGGELTNEQAKVLANFINVSTGRGAFNQRYGPALVAANDLLLAPRFQVSRIQYLIGQPLWGAGPWKNTSRARKVVAQEYARNFAGLAAYYSLIALSAQFMADDEEKPQVELDPRSSDFGKIRIGKTRIDPFAGVQQWMVFTSRMLSGETKSLSSGELVPFRGDDTEFGSKSGKEVAIDFLRGRLAPVPGALYDRFVSGTTFDGKEATVMELTKNLFLPISAREIVNTTMEEGIPKGSALGILAIFGERISTYGDPEINISKYQDDPSLIPKRLKTLRRTINSGTRKGDDETREEYQKRKEDHARRKSRARLEKAELDKLLPPQNVN